MSMTRASASTPTRPSQSAAATRIEVGSATGRPASSEPLRTCYINDRMKNIQYKFPGNSIRTFKYSVYPYRLDFFLWKNLYEQFLRLANVYFLIIAALQLVPDLSPTGRFTTLFTLSFVLAFSALKAALEDFGRHKSDKNINNLPSLVLRGSEFVPTPWNMLQVGDIVKVVKQQDFPADILLLSSSEEEGVAYVETANLDGETNLKPKRSLPQTLEFIDEANLAKLSGKVEMEPPNRDLYSFTGSLLVDDQWLAVEKDQILLRGSQLRKAAYIVGIVLYTGPETKVMLNSSKAPHKRSKVERQVNHQLRWVLLFQFALCLFCAIELGLWTKNKADGVWFLKETTKPIVKGISGFFTFFILFNNLIPISLYVSLEMVKYLQGTLINSDLKMFFEDRDMPAIARSTSLNEELGQVDYIFSDKTGTLTMNVMKFLKFSVADTSYGEGTTEIGRAAAKRMGRSISDPRPLAIQQGEFQFYDQRILDGHWRREPHAAQIREFFSVLAVCHTVIPEMGPDGKVRLQAESPDEAALVAAARHFGFIFKSRTSDSVVIEAEGREEVYRIRGVLEFNSDRKRMSVLVQPPKGPMTLYCKGADSVIYERLAPHQKHADITQTYLDQFAQEGLRTLVLAKLELETSTFQDWLAEYQAARRLLGKDREAAVSACAERVERNLVLLGCSAIEDKLQEAVGRTIETLRAASVAVWVLTGDKQETAINIGYACALLHNDMHVMTFSQTHREELESALDAAMAEWCDQDEVELAVVITGACLAELFLHTDLRRKLSRLSNKCSSVICCRVSPLQKADVVQLVRSNNPDAVTLAIGDGANDVSMIQAAHVGIGISGMEGQQAANSADYAIGQFRYLQRLMMLHGRWSYIRVSRLILYSFYKNILLQLTQFWFCLFNGFSGQSLYEQWVLAMYNVLFTFVAIVVYAVLDRDIVTEQRINQFPGVYTQGQRGDDFNTTIFLRWLVNAIFHSAVCFFIPWLSDMAGTTDLYSHGTVMYTCVIFVVNLKLALEVQSWTVAHHVVIWGSILVWPVFLFLYGPMTLVQWRMYGVFNHLLGTAVFYLTVLLTVVVALGRDFAWKYISYHVRSPEALETYKYVQIVDHYDLLPLPSERINDDDEGDGTVTLFAKAENGPERDYQHSGLWLTFHDFEMEDSFLQDYYGSLNRYRLVALLTFLFSLPVVAGNLNSSTRLATAMWALFGAAGLVFLVLLFTVRDRVRRHVHLVTSAIFLVAFVGMFIGHLSSADASDSAPYRHPTTPVLVVLGILLVMRPPIYSAVQYLAMLFFLYAILYQFFKVKLWTPSMIFGRFWEIFIVSAVSAAVVYSAEDFFRRLFANTKEFEDAAKRLEKEEERSLLLLRNVLPEAVVRKVNQKNVHFAAFSRTFGTGSVLVSDIVQFTKFSSSHDAVEVIEMLNNMFTRFDKVCQELYLEKIKTIGDAYVCTGGVPISDEQHMSKIADMGLAMVKCVEEMDRELKLSIQIRVGIATGTLTAGIVGLQKLCYDIYGPAVKEAEEMEQTGAPQSVQCSPTLYAALKDKYLIETVPDSLYGQERYFIRAKRDGLRTLQPDRQLDMDNINYIEGAEDPEDLRQLFETNSDLIVNASRWRQFDGGMKKWNLAFTDSVIENEFSLYMEVLAQQHLTLTYSLGLFVAVALPILLAFVFPQYRKNFVLVLLYAIIPIQFAVFCLALWRRQRERLAAATKVTDSAVPTSKSEQRLVTMEEGGGSGLGDKLVRASSISEVRPASCLRNRHKMYIYVVGFTLSVLIIIMLLAFNDRQMGPMLPVVSLAVLVFLFSSYYIFFWQKLVFGLLLYVVSIAVYFYDKANNTAYKDADWREDILAISVTYILLLASMYIMEQSIRRGFVLEKQILLRKSAIEHTVRISENMLMNVLPRTILERLRLNPDQQIIDSVEGASVLFLYFKGLDDFSSDADAYHNIRQLNHFLAILDKLTIVHKVEKIKTHPFLVVSGCPERRPDHAEALLRLALDFFAAVKKYQETHKNEGDPIKMKCGIHSGRVSAGVLGRNKWVYDVFGDTVNLSSRLTSSGDWGRIQVSEAVKQATEHLVSFRARGQVELKGKGLVNVYYVDTQGDDH
eukprot:TRINITY_DN5119_c0_g2_i1.p1 TRINITY_DN5119_c0_g2~~TRINITY_DN5119_c0_g2_i1.p1  ORF type:complete len:2092 (+),score=538.26 TRINITY_DN5119_c0_g2_i1:622-6897(+)